MEDQTIVPEKLEKVVNVPCKACGSEMVYNPEKRQLECKHCGQMREIPIDNDLVIERPFNEALDLQNAPMGFGTQTKTFKCKGCGAETAVPPDQVEFACPFCSSTNVNAEAHQNRMIQPAAIIPFLVSEKSSADKFKEWIGKGWFRPSALKKFSQMHAIKGVYVPFWTYDAETSSSWSAMSGYYYYTSETRVENGKTVTRQVKHTRWVPSSGYHELDFDDVLISGSTGLKQNTAEWIYPFELKELVNYDSKFILGLSSEVYQIDVQAGFKVADGKMDAAIRSEISKTVPGDTHRDLSINTKKYNIHFKHILLPIWIAAYQFRGKTFQFLVNGQTGKISGRKPVSWGKVFFAIGVAVAIGVGLYFTFRKH